jgi:hypothetical protein
MKKEQFSSEMLYQLTISMFRKMLEHGLISEEEYAEIDTIMLRRYAPFLGSIYR